MRIGIPREIKLLEGRVALIPAACGELVNIGHQLFVERGAGRLSGYSDDAYVAVGARILNQAAEVYDAAQLIVKVKEPQAEELSWLQPEHVLFSFLHLAAIPELGYKLKDIGLTAIAFETVQEGSTLPLLAPMSDIAGRIAVQVGTHLLHQPQGGSGLLLGGIPASERGNVVVIGGGVAGFAAASVAVALGANVIVFDKQHEKLIQARSLGANVTALYAFQPALEEALLSADLVIGAVLLPGKRTPHVVSRNMVSRMRESSVIADISVDQGGCVETTRAATYAEQAYREEGVLHFTVTNMPGAVPRTASQALSACLMPYLARLASASWRKDPALAAGVNVAGGEFVNPVIRQELSH